MSALAAAGTVPAAVRFVARCPSCARDALWTARRTIAVGKTLVTSESGRSDVACGHCDTEEAA